MAVDEAEKPRPVHLVVILHGLWGTRDHIAYISRSVKRAAEDRLAKEEEAAAAQEVGGEGSSVKRKKGKVIVLEAAGNEWTNTYDGIDFCAHRVQEEIISTISALHSPSPLTELSASAVPPNPNVKGYSTALPPFDMMKEQLEGEEDGPWRVEKFTLVGYSLGGLIARYVLGILENESITSLFPNGKLPEDLEGKEKDHFFDLVKPLNFATFATPHIGIPRYKGFGSRFFTFFGARLLSRTGPQLYAQDNFGPTAKSEGKSLPLLEVMSEPGTSFHTALSRFRHISIYANAVNDMTVTFPTGSIEETDWFAAAGWKSRKARRERLKAVGRDSAEGEGVAGPEEGEKTAERYRWGWGNLEWGGVAVEEDPVYAPLLKSYSIIEPSIPPFEKLSEEEEGKCRRKNKGKWKRFIPRPPGLLRPSSYPFRAPLNYLVVIFLPVVFPGFLLYLIGQFLLQGRQSRGRIRELKTLDHLSTEEKRLTRVGVVLSQISDNAKQAVAGVIDALQPAAVAESDETLASPKPSSAPLRRRSTVTSRNIDLSGFDVGGTSGYETPPLSTGGGGTEEDGNWSPILSECQKRIVTNMNGSLKQLKKFYAYFPYIRNAHGAIICRDEKFEWHQAGKRVVDHFTDHLEL
ncbi:DUF676-domain-containing protein [Atractiella rhizophila]|nr:DUF676-domain-containing protein [Atractiella rhizophila]